MSLIGNVMGKFGQINKALLEMRHCQTNLTESQKALTSENNQPFTHCYHLCRVTEQGGFIVRYAVNNRNKPAGRV